MMLARRTPEGDHFEKQTFECPGCDLIETKIVRDPDLEQGKLHEP
jgi:hypothetical protein